MNTGQIRRKKSLSQHAEGDVRLFCKQEGKAGLIPIFMVHGDESNRAIPAHLPAHIPFFAFYHPVDYHYKTAQLDLGDLASLYVDALRNVQPGGPYFLSGYSIGGLIALEMARMLQSQGETISALILLDTRTPELSEKREYHNRQFRWNESLAARVMRKIYKRSMVTLCRIFNRNIPDAHLPFFLMERYREARAWHTTDPYAGDIILIRSSKDNFKDPELGWGNIVQGKIKRIDLDTDHHHITLEPAVGRVAQIFQEVYGSV